MSAQSGWFTQTAACGIVTLQRGIFLGLTREILVSDQPKLVLNLSEAAEILGIKPSQLYEHTRARSRARQRIPIPYLRWAAGAWLSGARVWKHGSVQLEAEMGVRQ